VQEALRISQEENKKLELRYNEAVNIVKRTKDFVVNKLGRIPFIGKAVINAMNKELNQKALPEKDEGEEEINRLN
jgi:CMP-2-keto-3-deoxyoctulosonic acid synthetase